jgi:hypothetical protein
MKVHEVTITYEAWQRVVWLDKVVVAAVATVVVCRRDLRSRHQLPCWGARDLGSLKPDIGGQGLSCCRRGRWNEGDVETLEASGQGLNQVVLVLICHRR